MNCSPCGSVLTSNYPLQSIPTGLNSGSHDTFDRLSTQTPTTLLTSHVSFTPQLEIIGYVSTGSGSVFIDLSNCVTEMSTTTVGRAIKQTLEYQLYQPGKTHQVYMTWTPQYTGTFDSYTAVRCGIFDDYRDKNTPSGTMGAPPYQFVSSINGGLGQETNQTSMGHFFELSGNTWFVVERFNSIDNISNITRIHQSNWNVDTLNPSYGRNPSGITLARNREGLFFIERQWLGVGLVNFGLYNQGKRIICHQIFNRGYKVPYTNSNKIPLRYEIEKVAGGSSAPAATAAICMASQIDGEYIPIGATFSLPSNLIAPSTRIDQTLRPILLLRLQQKYCRASIKIKDVQIYGSASGLYSIFKNPIISGTITWVDHPDPRSMVQYAIFANGGITPTNTVTGGQCINSGFFTTRTAAFGNQSVQDLIAAPAISSDIRGVPDVWCMAMIGFQGNPDVNAVATWIEIT